MSEKPWKKRFLSSLCPNSVPLPPRKHPRISATVCDPDDSAFDDHRELKFHGRVPVLEGGRKLDPDYGFFCDNVREEEKGFVLEIAAKDGAMPLTIRYDQGSSGGLVAKTPKTVRIGMEKMEEFPCSAKRNTLDGDARDTCVSEGKDTSFSDGGGLAGDCEMLVNDREGSQKLDPTYQFFLEKMEEAKTPKAAMIGSEKMGSPDVEVPGSSERNNLDVMEESNARLDDDGNAKDTCFSDGDGLAGGFEMLFNGWDGSRKLDPSYKFFLENLKEEPRGYKLEIAAGEEAVPLVISYDMSASEFSNGVVAKTAEPSLLGTEKMGIDDGEVPCRSERNNLDIVEQKNARVDDDAEDTIKCATRAIGYCDGVVVETPEVVKNGTGYVGSHHEEVPHSCKTNNLEVMGMNNTRLDDEGDAEDTHIADGDGLTVNCEIVADSRYLDGNVAKTETQNVVSNETQDVGCHHDEVTLSTKRVGSEVMEENNVGIDHDGDVVAKCDERYSSEVMEVENTWLDQFSDAKYNCAEAESLKAIEKKARLDGEGDAEDTHIADGDGLTVNCEIVANSGYLDGIVGETETQNVVRNETQDMGCHHDEVTLSTEKVGSEVMKESTVGIDHDGDDVAKCDERHSSEVMEVENTWLDQFGDANYNCTEAESLEGIEKKARWEDDGDDEDIHIGDGDGLTVNCENVVNRWYIDGIVAETETQNVVSNETRDVGWYHKEVTLSTERFGSEVMEENNVRIDNEVDAEANCDERHSSEVIKVKNTWLDQFGDAEYNYTEAESLEAIEKIAILDGDGDDEDTHIADGDDLTLNCEIVAHSRYFDGIVAETETQNVVRNEILDVGCYHEEVTLTNERVGSEVMEENNVGIDHDADAEAKCDERHSSDVMEVENTWLDQFGEAKYNCTEGETLEAIEKEARLDDAADAEDTRIAGGDGLTVNCDILAYNRYLDEIVAEAETQNVVSNETQDMDHHHEEVTLSTERVGLEVMEEDKAGINHHSDADTKCDERHSAEVMGEKNTWLDEVGDAKYGCTEGESLEAIENMNDISVEDGSGAICFSDCDRANEVSFGSDFIGHTEGNCVSDSNCQTKNNCVFHGDGAIEVDFLSDGISVWKNNAKGNYVSDYGDEVNDNRVFHSNGCGIVAESETQKVVSNETLDMGCHHQEVTLSTKSVGSEVMEENNAGIDHYGVAEAKCDEIYSSEAMEKKNIWLDQVCASIYNCTGGESLEAIENMNARSVGNDDGDYSVSDFDRFIEVNFGSDFNGNTEGNRVPDSFHQTENNCVSHGDGGIEVNFVSDGIADCNNTAKGNCVSDCNEEEKDNCVFHGNDYGEAKDNSASDDLDANDNCAPHSDADCDPKGNCSSEVNGGDNENCVSGCDEDKDPCDSDRDGIEYHCVSDGDDVNEHSASGEDDLRYYSASDADVECYCLSDDDDAIDRCVSMSGTSKHGSDSDAMVDECYKLFLRNLKPDGEVADFPTHNGKTKRADHNGGTDSDEEEKPSIDRLNSPFPSFSRRRNTGRTPVSTRIKLSKFTDNLKFREELMYALKKPYDQNEYEILWDDISRRLPAQGWKELRGQSKMYRTTRVGKSLLDDHPDLALVIKSVEKDQPRVLNLLRGFFYWLKKAASGGKFPPWKDSACLEILPET